MYYDRNDKALISRFEEMLTSNQVFFFDVHEFEAIAEHYYSRGQAQKAVQAMRLAQNQHPLSSTLPLKQAQYLVALNKLDEAGSALDHAEGLDPSSSELFMARATLYSRRGMHRKAIKLLKIALDKGEDPMEVHTNLAVEHQSLGEYEEAIFYHKKSLADYPEDEVSIFNIAICFEQLGKLEDGINYFKSFIDRNPYNEVAWYHLGLAQGKLKHYDKAIESFEYALLIDEHFLAGYYEIARMHERTGDWEKAALTYERSMEFDTPTGYIYYKLGHCFLQMNQNKEAMLHLNRAIHEDEELDEAYLELAAIHAVEGNRHEAMHNLNKALELDAENPDYLYTAIEIYGKLNLKLNMIETYKQIIATGFDDGDMYLDYAELLIEMDEVTDAVRILKEAAAKHSEHDDVHLMLAGYQFADGKYSEGLEHLIEAYKIDKAGLQRFSEYFPELQEDPEVSVLMAQLKSSM